MGIARDCGVKAPAVFVGDVLIGLREVATFAFLVDLALALSLASGLLAEPIPHGVFAEPRSCLVAPVVVVGAIAVAAVSAVPPRLKRARAGWATGPRWPPLRRMADMSSA